LTYSVTEGQLQELFGAHGTVKDVTVIGNKGFGFVEMNDAAEAGKAKEALDGQDLQGRTLRIDIARPKEARAPRSDYNSY
jgi:RNA recognition motif-containing protein